MAVSILFCCRENNKGPLVVNIDIAIYIHSYISLYMYYTVLCVIQPLRAFRRAPYRPATSEEVPEIMDGCVDVTVVRRST